ncbi:hypothetical protein KIN20_036046 [Parelaphostrongylus tenuis]|uniref:DUF7758 domain-containing protein n=1 Tax=Parelaphostrongylus tenuis TaxID=148309 RepID=A0AAD5RC30_PARTN|nr:hypothetical protein KIN20_036046 [Parelaphostrongylus tenuis]
MDGLIFLLRNRLRLHIPQLLSLEVKKVVSGEAFYFTKSSNPMLRRSLSQYPMRRMLLCRYFNKTWRKVKADLLSTWHLRCRRFVKRLAKCLKDESYGERQRRKSQAKLQPLPDRPIRRVASKLVRKPTNNIEKLRRKGDNWTANDLFQFQDSDPEEGTSEERRELCYAWLDRLHAIDKKYCYLAWYEAAIYACYYRLAPIIADVEQKRKIWTNLKREYAEIFLMGRRIWRRASHPARLRVFCDMAMLCIRFGEIDDDSTAILFREALDDVENSKNWLPDEIQFAKSVDKITVLENHVIDQFYTRRRLSGSFRSSFRSKKLERSPSRTHAEESAGPVEQQQLVKNRPIKTCTKSLEDLTLPSTNVGKRATSLPIYYRRRSTDQDNDQDENVDPNALHRLVHFDEPKVHV